PTLGGRRRRTSGGPVEPIVADLNRGARAPRVPPTRKLTNATRNVQVRGLIRPLLRCKRACRASSVKVQCWRSATPLRGQRRDGPPSARGGDRTAIPARRTDEWWGERGVQVRGAWWASTGGQVGFPA